MVEFAVSVQNVTKTFNFKKSSKPKKFKDKVTKVSEKKLVVLDNVSFDVLPGEILGIIGLNGSGKTTLLRTIAGIYQPDSGKVLRNGRLAPLLHIGTGFHGELTSSENILISGMLYGLSKDEIKDKTDAITEFAELEEFVNMELKHYSSGMKARLAFSIAMQIDPDIVLVDEILSVGDIGFREKSLNEFMSFKKRNKTIIIITHNLGILPQLCDKVLFLDHGKVIEFGSPQTVIQKYKEFNNQLQERKKFKK